MNVSYFVIFVLGFISTTYAQCVYVSCTLGEPNLECCCCKGATAILIVIIFSVLVAIGLIVVGIYCFYKRRSSYSQIPDKQIY